MFFFSINVDPQVRLLTVSVSQLQKYASSGDSVTLKVTSSTLVRILSLGL